MNIYICCVSGYSSSILARNLEKWLSERLNEEVYAESSSFRQIKDEGEMADLILIAPQMAWAAKEISSRFPDTPVIKIDSVDYGRGRPEPVGQKIIDSIRSESEG